MLQEARSVGQRGEADSVAASSVAGLFRFAQSPWRPDFTVSAEFLGVVEPSLDPETAHPSDSLLQSFFQEALQFTQSVTLTPARTQLTEELSPVEQELLLSTEVTRMADVFQMQIRFSDRGDLMQHNRLQHSVDAMQYAGLLARRCGLDERETQKLRIAALLHDLGHPPFAHAGESTLVTFDRAFDHDRVVNGLIRNGGIAGILKRHAIEPEEIIEILHRGPLEPLKDWADRLAYLKRDSENTRFSPNVRLAFELLTAELVSNIAMSEGRVCFHNPQIVKECIGLRAALFQEYAFHPVSDLVREILVTNVRKLILSGELDIGRFPRMTDVSVLEVLSSANPRAYRWLEDGVENHFVPVAAFRLNELTRDGVRHVTSNAFRRELRAIYGDDCYPCTTGDYSKEMDVLVVSRSNGAGELHSVNLKHTVPSSRRTAFVVFPRDFGIAALEECRAAVADYMEPYLTSSARDRSQELFGNVDDDLFA